MNIQKNQGEKFKVFLLTLTFILGVFCLVKLNKTGVSNFKNNNVSVTVINLKEKPFINIYDVVGSVLIIASVFGFYSILRNKKTPLTNQEQKIYNFIKQGFSNKEIASELNISLSTVKTHINNLYKKMNVSSRKDLV